MSDEQKKASFLDEFSEKKPESFGEEVFVANKKEYKSLIIGISIGLSLLFLLLYVFVFRGVEIPDMSEWNVGQVGTWAEKNKITLIARKEYDIEVKSDYVLEQSVQAGKRLRRGKELEVVFSNGPDPEEKINVIDFSVATYEEIQRWIEENQLTGVTVKREFSNTVEVDMVIEYKFVDGSEEVFLRKNRLRIVMSKGPEEVSETIKVKDFYRLTQNEVNKWAQENSILVSFNEEESEYIEPGLVIRQSVKGGESMPRKDTLEVFISLGIASETPNFVGMSSSEASSLASLKKLQIFMREVESTREEGMVVSQDIPAGTSVFGDEIITLSISKGNAKVPNFVGLDRQSAEVLATSMDIAVLFKDVETTEKKKDNILSQSIQAGKMVSDKDTVILEVVKNSGVEVIDMTEMSKFEAELWATQNEIALTFIEQYSDQYSYDTLFGQSVTEGIIPEGEQMYVYQSLGRVTLDNYIGKSRLEVLEWQKDVNAKGGNVLLTYDYIVDTNKTRGTILNQSIKEDYIPLDAVIHIEVSGSDNGVVVPRMATWTKEQIIAWCEKNDVDYRFEEYYDNDDSVGEVISQNYEKKQIPQGEQLVIRISLGPLGIPSFVGKGRLELMDWVNDVNNKGGRVTVDTDTVRNTTEPKGTIIYQSEQETYIDLNEEIEIKVSGFNGGTYIRDLTGMTADQAIDWCTENRIAFNVNEVYHNTVEEKNVISQTYSDDYLPIGKTLTIDVSKGKVPVKDFTDQPVSKLLEWQKEVNRRGGKIQLDFDREYSKEDMILTQSPSQGTVNVGSTIKVILEYNGEPEYAL